MTPLPNSDTNRNNNIHHQTTYMDAQMQRMEMPWFDGNVDDSGGGFVPDMAYWGENDDKGMQYNHM